MCCNIVYIRDILYWGRNDYVIWGRTDTGLDPLGPHRPAS
jgi:hypothetical protein